MKLKPSEEKVWTKLYKTSFPDPSTLECSLNDYLFRLNENNMNDVALQYFNCNMTFAELREMIHKTAHALEKLGVKKGDIVTMCAVSTPEVIALFYAMDLLGVTANMIDPRSSMEGIREYIKEVHSKLVVTLDVAYPRIKQSVIGTDAEKVLVVSPADSLKGLLKIGYKLTNKTKFDFAENTIVWKDFYALAANDNTLYSTDNFDTTVPCIILHTGGTSGIPKCVMLNAKALNASAEQYIHDRLDYGFGYSKQKLLNVMPPFIAYGFAIGVHTVLSHGVTSILIPNIDPKKLGSLLLKYKPQHMAGVPLHYQELAVDPKMKGKDLSFLITTGCGGDGINEAAEKKVNDFFKAHKVPFPLCKGYSLTEVTATSVANNGDRNKLGSVGYPLCYTTVGIFDPATGEELDYYQEGEICIKGPHMMMGYYHNERETNAALQRHADGDLWLHSGDIGTMDPDGYIYIRSRIKRVIVRHDGFKIYATTIENCVGEHEAVMDCSAVANKDKDHMQGNLPVLFFSRKAGVTTPKEELIASIKEHCKTILPEYFLPRDYVELDELPHTLIGKIDYRALEEKANELFGK